MLTECGFLLVLSLSALISSCQGKSLGSPHDYPFPGLTNQGPASGPTNILDGLTPSQQQSLAAEIDGKGTGILNYEPAGGLSGAADLVSCPCYWNSSFFDVISGF